MPKIQRIDWLTCFFSVHQPNCDVVHKHFGAAFNFFVCLFGGTIHLGLKTLFYATELRMRRVAHSNWKQISVELEEGERKNRTKQIEIEFWMTFSNGKRRWRIKHKCNFDTLFMSQKHFDIHKGKHKFTVAAKIVYCHIGNSRFSQLKIAFDINGSY